MKENFAMLRPLFTPNAKKKKKNSKEKQPVCLVGRWDILVGYSKKLKIVI